MATFKELVDGLSMILKEHPELADREVCHASECGYSDAGFESPVALAIPHFHTRVQRFCTLCQNYF